jgi:hypothetical protein
MLIRIISLALLVGGIALTKYGYDASNSFGSEVSKVFTGNPSDRSMYLLVGGIVMMVFGAGGLASGFRKK